MSESSKTPPSHESGVERLMAVVHDLRSPGGCPWDREQDHKSIRFPAIEEVYELVDAIEADDDIGRGAGRNDPDRGSIASLKRS